MDKNLTSKALKFLQEYSSDLSKNFFDWEIDFNKIYGIVKEPSILLKGLRYREGLNQVKFAKKLGLTQSYISIIENGKRPISKKLAKKIQDIFNLDYKIFYKKGEIK